MRKKRNIVLIVFLVGLIYFIYQYFSITKIGEEITPEDADVIIILGAGVWENGPSPALQARVNQGKEVYEQGYAKALILTGGLGQFPPTEAEAMQDLLLEMEIPKEALYLEKKAVSTEENIKFSKAIMDQNGWTKAIIVTDVFHMKRALLLAKDQGITVTGSSAIESVLYTNDALRIKYTIREVLANTEYTLKKIF